MISQREAVYKATMSVLASNSVVLASGVNIKSVMTDSMKNAVVTSVVGMFQRGEVDLKANESNAAKLADAKKLRQYVVGLVANWFAKDPNLNGGLKVKPSGEKKERAPKTDIKDDKLKELASLKALLKEQGKDTAEVDKEISARKAELEKPKQAKKPPVNLGSIPEEFKDLLE